MSGEQDPGLQQLHFDIAQAEEQRVDRLGSEIGYGRVMQAASKMWAQRATAEGRAGEGMLVGPHRGLTEPCFCRRPRSTITSCDWCCGCGWLTKAVANMIEHG